VYVFEEEEDVKALRAKDIMTRDVLLARADWSIHRLAEFLAEHSISGAPVVSEDGKLIGVVSSTDIVIHDTLPVKEVGSGGPHEYYLQASERRHGSEQFASAQIAGEPLVTVRDIMTPVIYKVSEDTPVPKVADTMIKNRIHRVFVTHRGQLVGIIATPEMLQVVRDL
jgi:CBS domain-containing protein